MYIKGKNEEKGDEKEAKGTVKRQEEESGIVWEKESDEGRKENDSSCYEACSSV